MVEVVRPHGEASRRSADSRRGGLVTEKSNLDKSCLACGEQISSVAVLCKHCQTHQSRWRNFLVFGAQISGFLTILAATVAFLVTSAPRVRTVLHWRDELRVLAFDSEVYVLVSNSGDGPVYVSHASLVYDLAPFGKVTSTIPLRVLVPQDTILSIPLPQGPLKEAAADRKIVFSDSSQKAWRRALQRAIQDDGCFFPVLFTATEPGILQTKEAYAQASQTIPTFPAQAKVVYFSLHDKNLHSTSVPVIGALMFSDAPECTRAR